MCDVGEIEKIMSFVKLVINRCDLVFDASRMEERLVISLNVERLVEDVMKEIETMEEIDKNIPVVVKFGKHSIVFKREVEVVKTVKTKGYNLFQNE